MFDSRRYRASIDQGRGINSFPELGPSNGYSVEKLQTRQKAVWPSQTTGLSDLPSAVEQYS